MPFRPVLAKIKLPPRPQELLSRSRLLDFLGENADIKFMAVSATAGYGKTSLLVDYAHQAEVPVCWYTLDRFDREPGAFFAHLLASVRQRFPEFGRQSETTLTALENPAREWQALAATAVNELYETIPEYFTLVLDDYHHIEDVVPINEFLAYLLQYSDEHCHLILASRRLPRLPNQALLFGRGQMAGLATEDLRFTREEIQALARQNYDLDLPMDKATELAGHFEGWITGILLNAQAGWERWLEEAVQAHAVGHVYDYLAEQVFADQPPEVQAFMLESAVLERMEVDLLDALREAEDSARWLAEVGERQLFLISLDDEGRWFRYHQLFREFLQARLRREARGRFEALHRRAAALFEAQREWPEAFEHYAQAGVQEEMVRLLETAAEALYTAGHWDTLQDWIGALPAEAVEENPTVAYYQGSVLAVQGDLRAALHCVNRARRGFEARGDALQVAWVLVLRATALRLQGDYAKALSTGEEALSIAAEFGDRELLATVQQTIGVIHYHAGVVEKAIGHFEEALRLFQELDHSYNAARLHHDLGIAYRAKGQWPQAVAHYHQANRIWEQLGNLGFWAITLNSVGIVHHLRGEFAEAHQILTQALEKARAVDYRRTQAAILASLGDLYRDAGQYQAAGEVFQQSVELADEVGEGFIRVYARQGLGDTLRLSKDYQRADFWLSEALEQAKEHNSAYEIGLCELARGVLWTRLGRQARAWLSLSQAQEFFEQSGHLHELARSHFRLADLALQQGRRQDVPRHLSIVVELTQKLGYDSFVVVEGRQAKPLLEYAVSQNGHQSWWANILARTARPPAPLTAEPQQAAPARQPLRIYALGQDRVQSGGEETKTGRPKVRELFFYLLAHRPQGVHRDQIVVDFWPEATPSKAALSLKSALYRLRRLYTEVHHKDGRYTPDLPEGSWYDVEAFEALLDEAQATEIDRARIEVYRQALQLYGGDYLATFDSPWCNLERERLRERYRRGLHALAELHFSQGEYAESQDLYRRALEVDAFDEAACQGLLRSYAGAGQRPQALALYHQFAQHLYQEMGITPAPETEAVYQELLRQGDEDA
jgi:LuxR family maltose regulon positive regulatory protein